MEDELPPALPISTNAQGSDEAPVFARVAWADISGGSEDAEDAPPSRLPIAEWRERAAEALASQPAGLQHPSGMLCRASLVDEAGQRLVLPEAALDRVCAQVVTTHRLHLGIAVLADGDLMILLPDGVDWSGLAATLERRGDSPTAQSPATRTSGARARFGLADLDPAAPDLDRALVYASNAIERAHEKGSRADVWSDADEDRRQRERTIVTSLVSSLERGEGFRLVFQPKYDTQRRRLVGAEGLLRHEGGPFGSIGPAEFLPIAERAGILADLERWVVEEGIAAIRTWSEACGLDVPISLNVRGIDLVRDGFVDELHQQLVSSGVDPSLLRLEVSEADVLQFRGRAESRLGALRDLGVSIALDDFGRQGTTITDLGGLPIDVLKVHRSFIAEMTDDPSAAALVRGVMSLAGALGIETVAAGVETEVQFDTLRSLGCGAVQGFLLSKPLEFAEFDELLRMRRRSAA